MTMTTDNQKQSTAGNRAPTRAASTRIHAAILRLCGAFAVLTLTAFGATATDQQPQNTTKESITTNTLGATIFGGAAARGAAQPYLRDIVINTANGDKTLTDSFTAFYKQRQINLFQAIDAAIAQKARAHLQQFQAVKSAQVEFQTKLAGRKGNLAADLIGAIAEQQDNAIGWQLRGYVGQEQSRGANAGVFYRAISGGVLYGANAFIDYENHDHGAFTRYSIGGEVSHSIFSLAANYYEPITDNKNINATVVAFTRAGYDAQLRLFSPDFEVYKLALDYYDFDGKSGTASDDGFRVGIEAHPMPALRFNLFYDDGGDTFGADITYTHNIGESRGYGQGSNPAVDLFAPVNREYVQRIALATVGAGSPRAIGGNIASGAPVGMSATIGIFDYSRTYFTAPPTPSFGTDLPRREDITHTDPAMPPVTVYYTPLAANQSGAITFTIQGMVAQGTATVLTTYAFSLTVSSFAAFTAHFAEGAAVAHLTASTPAIVGTLTSSGGIRPYTYTRTQGDIQINDGIVSFNRQTPRAFTAIIAANDSSNQTPEVLITLNLEAIDSPIAFANAPVLFDNRGSYPIATIIAPGVRIFGEVPQAGIPGIQIITSVSPTIIRAGGQPSQTGNTFTLMLTLRGGALSVVVTTTLTAYAEFRAAFDGNPALSHLTASTPAIVGTITTSGGLGNITYTSSNPNVVVATNGAVTYTRTAIRQDTAIITIDDAISQTPAIMITLSLEAADSPIAITRNNFIEANQSHDIATIILEGAAIHGTPQPAGRYGINNGVIQIINPGSGDHRLTLTITAMGDISVEVSISLTAFNELAAGFSGNSGRPALVHITSAAPVTIGSITTGGGNTGAAYTYASSNPQVAIVTMTSITDIESIVATFTPGAAVRTLTAIITIDDAGNPQSPAVMLSLTLEVVDSAILRSPNTLVALNIERNIATIVLEGGAIAGNIPSAAHGCTTFQTTVIRCTPTGAGIHTIPLTITSDAIRTSATLTIRAYDTLAASFTGTPVYAHLTATTPQTVGIINPRGGTTPYIVSAQPAEISVFRIANDARILFTPGASGRTLMATVTIDDTANDQTAPITIAFTLTAISMAPPITAGIVGSGANLAVLAGTGSNNNIAVITVAGGVGAYTYTGVSSPFAIIGTNGNRVTIRYGNNSAQTVSLTLVIDDTDSDTTPVTLALTARAIAPLSLDIMPTLANAFFLTIPGSQTFGRTWGTISVSGGTGGYTTTRISGDTTSGFGDGSRLTIFTGRTHQTLSYIYEYADSGTYSEATPNVRVSITITAVTEIPTSVSVSMQYLNSVGIVVVPTVSSEQTLTVGTLRLSGGLPPYGLGSSQTPGQDGDFRFNNEEVLLALPSTYATLSATFPPIVRTVSTNISASDDLASTPNGSVPITATLVAPLTATVSRTGPINANSGGIQDIGRVYIFGGLLTSSAHSYTRTSDSPSGFSRFASTSGRDQYRLRGSFASTGAGTYTWVIRVDDDNNANAGEANDPTPAVHLTVRVTVQ